MNLNLGKELESKLTTEEESLDIEANRRIIC